MNLNQTVISLKKMGALCIDIDSRASEPSASPEVVTASAELINLGFCVSQPLYLALLSLPNEQLATLVNELIAAAKYLKGADVTYQAMYPGFPKQLIEAEEGELYFNALLHYWTQGQWLPEFEIEKRTQDKETVKLQEIGLATTNALMALFPQLLSSADSLSEEDKAIIKWFMTNDAVNGKLEYPKDIPFAETRCIVAGELLEQHRSFSHLINTASDILRLATYLSEGDVSLSSNTKFKSFPRKVRKALVIELERVINEEDIGRHRNKWIRLFHALHVGDYSKTVFDIAAKARNNERLASFYSDLELAIEQEDLVGACRLLKKRPGEFGRRLDQVLRLGEKTKQQIWVCNNFLDVIDSITTRNTLQLLGHLKTRGSDSDKAIIFPKGPAQNAIIVERDRKAIESNVLSYLIEGVRKSLFKRFSDLPSLGKVWLDPELMLCPLPSQQRSASTALRAVARGTRLPIGEKDTLRFFIYWQGRDIDLSATFHDEKFDMIEHVSYTNLKSANYRAYHSGDITSAPGGACEFIDIAIDSASKRARYVAMNVLVFSGPSFAEHKICYAGWMTRSKPNSNEVFEPATVAQKIDVRAPCRNVIPVVFDLQERRAIWVDLKTSANAFHFGNNIESNRASIVEKLTAIVESSNKLSLYELFELHAIARGKLVEDKSVADSVFSLEEGIGPHQINEINANFIS